MIEITDNDCISCVLNSKTAVALGLFDGVHLGHQQVIKAAAEFKKKGLSAGVFTFKTNTVTSKGGKIDAILSDRLKAEKFCELGAEFVFSPEFGKCKELSPEDFVKEILVKKLNAGAVVCGYDFRFGKGAQGDCKALKDFGKKYGFETVVVEPMRCEGEIVSSTFIRELVREGKIAKANKLMGGRFPMELEVVHGQAVGRTWNFPTINQIIPENQVKPKFGVYCSRVLMDGRWYDGVTNIGIKPTVEVKTGPLAETFIMGYEGDLYGRILRLELFEFIRAEKKFASLEELKAEIADNKRFAQEYFKNLKG